MSDLQHDVERLEDALNTPEAIRTGRWASDRSNDTRDIHLAVWSFRPDPSYVHTVVIPLFERTRSALRRVPVEDDYSDSIPEFSENIEMRIGNLHRFVAGKPSVTDPAQLAGSSR